LDYNPFAIGNDDDSETGKKNMLSQQFRSSNESSTLPQSISKSISMENREFGQGTFGTMHTE
jgi:hypothetical protein